jgi:hypothetical protein
MAGCKAFIDQYIDNLRECRAIEAAKKISRACSGNWETGAVEAETAP